ncbi:hypothetical protein HN924_01485 [Candidatus Woesearchaeota archaeon]|jgi:glutamate/tyrosine decarboxylase-like PLP-dependent enzyme|nr:hypothetical protein [Candidatus Woesearchaeota archaeon]MBT7062621.1 hypothetical protein [Candidatus Woesearchaeota archaeon]MBT7402733.1 hypothetical protein [Candidatus Woesearchaeota archaeon]
MTETRTDKLVRDFPRIRYAKVPERGISKPKIVLDNVIRKIELAAEELLDSNALNPHYDPLIGQMVSALRRTPADYYNSGEEMAKPGTVNDQYALLGFVYAAATYNPNLVDSQMFVGPWEMAQEAKTMTADLLGLHIETVKDLKSEWVNHEKPPYVGGWFLNGGTESIIQATWAFRNKYFADLVDDKIAPGDFSVRKNGAFDIGNLPRPVILAPINAHLALEKAADMTGFGRGDMGVTKYYLTPEGRPDMNSFRTELNNILNPENKIGLSYVFVTAGDTERGIISNTQEIGNILRQECGKIGIDPPPILVDSAAQYLFAEVMRDSPNYTDLEGNLKKLPIWDFRVPEVSAIVVDPHKNQIPYPASLLIYRNPQMMKLTDIKHNYLSTDMHRSDSRLTDEEKENLQVIGSIPTSRGGYSAVATWMYYLSHGLEGIRAKKEKVWNNVKKVWSALEQGDLNKKYELMSIPETAIITLRLNPEWVASNHESFKSDIRETARKIHSVYQDNDVDRSVDSILAGEATYSIYKAINDYTSDMLYIGKSTSLRTLSREEYSLQSRINDLVSKHFGEKFECHEDTGILLHVMEHNELEHMEKLILRLNQEATNLIK